MVEDIYLMYKDGHKKRKYKHITEIEVAKKILPEQAVGYALNHPKELDGELKEEYKRMVKPKKVKEEVIVVPYGAEQDHKTRKIHKSKEPGAYALAKAREQRDKEAQQLENAKKVLEKIDKEGPTAIEMMKEYVKEERKKEDWGEPFGEVEVVHKYKTTPRTKYEPMLLELKKADGSEYYQFPTRSKRRQFVQGLIESKGGLTHKTIRSLREYAPVKELMEKSEGEVISKEEYQTRKAPRLSLAAEGLKQIPTKTTQGKYKEMLLKGGKVEVVEKYDKGLPQVVEEIAPYIQPEGWYTPGADTTVQFKLPKYSENALNVLRHFEDKGMIYVLYGKYND